MAKAPGPIKRAWYEWKMLRFPWRKKWLVGFDLQGNTFWEFKDALHSLRNRRIAKYHRSTHYGDVNVSPGWMQWLRHTRFEPPTLQEQQQEVQRQANIKLLAARADERWAAKPSALDAPDMQQPVQMLESRDPKSGVVQMNAEQELRSRGQESRTAEARRAEGPQNESGLSEEAPAFKAKKRMRINKEPKEDSPWKQAGASNPGDDWQPKAWTPPPRRRG
ncbi:hypothetical protein BU25DRAFT_344145 [Macroventuria anomochaeta]|uniref:Uncharacterized protein n=1 Tax=Macroventuria anomochaeta TaxID=301207 RepID=A0ACB6RW05_9PLEO|nr:uncharacterized protein BU25DRAFT_344145 [Macroventuria anomochaeta]KAF2626195.1 hypothetical protein BU25DRAFT_344145 [Macroventuria anomochaeta]